MKKFFTGKSKPKADKANPANQPAQPPHQGPPQASVKKAGGIALALEKLKSRAHAVERSTGSRPYGAFFLGFPTGVLLIMAQYLKPNDWAHLVLVCRSLQPVFQQPINTLKFSLQKKVMDSRVVPLTIFSDPFFVRFPPNFSEFEKLLKTGALYLKNLFSYDVQPWEIAALLGMEEALQETYGSRILDLQNIAGLGVLHLYCIGGQKHLVVSHLARYKPFFKVITEEDFLLAECATYTGQIEVLELLKNNYGCDLTRFNEKRGKTLLHIATNFGQTPTVRYLLKQGLDPKIGRCLPLEAAKGGHWGLYSSLIKIDVKPRYEDEVIELIIYSARDGKKKYVSKLAAKIQKDVPSVVYNGIDVFSAAVSGGILEMIQYCCQQEWGEITKRWSDGSTVLHVAASTGKLEAIRQLLALYPDQLNIKMVDKLGRSILFYSAENGDFEDFINLANYFDDAECLRQDSEGTSVVHVAAQHGRLIFLRQFVMKFGTDCLKVRDNLGRTALHYAVFSGNLSLMQWLVHQHGLSFGDTNKQDNTPLHLFVQSLNADSADWEDLVTYAEKFGLEYITEYRNSEGKSVKDYLELANQPKVLSEINAMCVRKGPKK